MDTPNLEDIIRDLNEGSSSREHISSALKIAGQDPESFALAREAIINSIRVRLDRCNVVIGDDEEAIPTRTFFQNLANRLRETLDQLMSEAPYAQLPNHVSGSIPDALQIPRCVAQNSGDPSLS